MPKETVVQIMQRYAREVPEDNVYVSEFLNKNLRHIESAQNSGNRQQYDIFNRTPEEIGAMKEKRNDEGKIIEGPGYSILQKIIREYIKTISFSERLTAFRQFNQLFDNNTDAETKIGRGEYDCSAIYNGSDTPPSKLCYICDVFDSEETEILLLKRLQIHQYETLCRLHPDMVNEKDSVANIEEEFGFSDRTRRTKYDHLQKEHDFLGSKIQIALKDDNVSYDNTVHPVFLALNLAEVNFLTTILRKHFQNDPLEFMAADIAYDVYRQLSEYGKAIIDSNARKYNIDFEKVELAYPITKEKKPYEPKPGYRKEDENNLARMEKLPCICEIITVDELDKKKKGVLKRDYSRHAIEVETNGEYCPVVYEFTPIDDAGKKIGKTEWINAQNIKCLRYIGFYEYMYQHNNI